MKKVFYFSKLLVLTSTLLFLVMLQGCKPKIIPNTNVKSTRENKRIVSFLETYKAALEKRSVDAVLELVARDFKDNMGSQDPALQIDYLALKENLEKLFPRIRDLRLGMFVQHIAKIDKDLYEAVFYFSKHVLTELPAGEKWLSSKEVNRMVLRRIKDKEAPHEFEIIEGI